MKIRLMLLIVAVLHDFGENSKCRLHNSTVFPLQYEKRFLLRCIHHLNRIALTIWTIGAFRVMNPQQWFFAKQINLKFEKVSPKIV